MLKKCYSTSQTDRWEIFEAKGTVNLDLGEVEKNNSVGKNYPGGGAEMHFANHAGVLKCLLHI